MDTPQTIEHRIQLDNRCQLAEEKYEIFARLFLELLPIASIPNGTHLKRIIFIADSEMAPTVNEILQEDEALTGSYSSVETAAPAKAVPLEKDGNLWCQIILLKGD